MDDDAVLTQGLTWVGHEAGDNPKQGRLGHIKTTAQNKGIELTFDAAKILRKAALGAIMGD